MVATVWSRPNLRSAKEATRETARRWLNALRTAARKGAYRRRQRQNFANKLRSKRGRTAATEDAACASRHSAPPAAGRRDRMTSFISARTSDFFTIGHSNLPADRFIALLKQADVTAIADVRSVPFSRWWPWFSQKALAERLAAERIGYSALGDALGGRPRERQLYRDGVADYEAMAATSRFRAGLEQLAKEIARHRVCLLCAEREPLDCHRCLLVGRALAERGLAPGHIRADGTIEPHAETEERLLELAGREADLFHDRAARLADAYRRRARAVAARLKV
jgi:hypothetical protein